MGRKSKSAPSGRNERREGDAPSGGGGGASRPVQNAAPAGYDPAEEPF